MHIRNYNSIYTCILLHFYYIYTHTLYPYLCYLHFAVYSLYRQQVEQECGVPVMSVVQLKHLVTHIRTQAQQQGLQTATPSPSSGEVELLVRIEAYRAKYGVEY